jgi:hypothetical protein
MLEPFAKANPPVARNYLIDAPIAANDLQRSAQFRARESALELI